MQQWQEPLAWRSYWIPRTRLGCNPHERQCCRIEIHQPITARKASLENWTVWVAYTLTDDNEFVIKYQATTNKLTIAT